MPSTIDPTLGGDLTPDGRSVDKSDLQTALTAARDEITALQSYAAPSAALNLAALAFNVGPRGAIYKPLTVSADTTVALAAVTHVSGNEIIVRLTLTGTPTLTWPAQFLSEGDGHNASIPKNLASDAAHWLRMRYVVDQAGTVSVFVRFDPTNIAEPLPATLAPQHFGRIFRVTTTGTTVVPSGSSLLPGFSCTVVNPGGSGLTRTLDGPSGIVTVGGGETATIDVLDNNEIVVSVGPHTVI